MSVQKRKASTGLFGILGIFLLFFSASTMADDLGGKINALIAKENAEKDSAEFYQICAKNPGVQAGDE